MDKITLIQEMNKTTIKMDEFERALDKSGINLPSEGDADSENGEFELDIDAEMPDDDIDGELSDEDPEGFALEDDELQDIVDWCEEECADESDEELKDILIDELAELELSPKELDAIIAQVITMLGRDGDEEIDDMGYGG